MSLWEGLRDIARRRPEHAALRARGEALDYGGLVAAIERRAEEIDGSTPLVPLEGALPLRFLVDFFAARVAGACAISHSTATPQALRRMREASIRSWCGTGGRVATVFFSSGSVGPSKAVPLSDANLAASALAFQGWAEIGPADRLAVGLSPAQVLGCVRGALNALLVGAEAVFFKPRRDPVKEAAALGATAVLLPTAMVALAARGASRVTSLSLLCGGGQLCERDADLVERSRGVRVRSGYGMTESAGLGSRQRLSAPRRAGSSGSAAPGLEVSIVGDDGEERPAGESGEIRLRGPAVFAGYPLREDPSPFDERARLRTGDVGFLDPSGELHVRGRLAFSLSAGDRILCAEEVEAAIGEHPGVAEAVVAPMGRFFGLLVVVREPSEGLVGEVRAYAQQRLPAFAAPRRILSVPEIPRTSAGKIDRATASKWLSEHLPSA